MDLYQDGVVLEELQEEKTWREIAKFLLPGGRIIANLGSSRNGIPTSASFNTSTISSLPCRFALSALTQAVKPMVSPHLHMVLSSSLSHSTSVSVLH